MGDGRERERDGRERERRKRERERVGRMVTTRSAKKSSTTTPAVAKEQSSASRAGTSRNKKKKGKKKTAVGNKVAGKKPLSTNAAVTKKRKVTTNASAAGTSKKKKKPRKEGKSKKKEKEQEVQADQQILPDELWSKVLESVNDSSVMAFACICKQLRRVQRESGRKLETKIFGPCLKHVCYSLGALLYNMKRYSFSEDWCLWSNKFLTCSSERRERNKRRRI